MLIRSIICLLVLVASRAQYYRLNTNLTVEEIPEDVAELVMVDENILAISKFTDDRELTGWNHLFVKTSPNHPDWLQTYSLGYMEGYIAYELVYAAWNNAQVYRASNNLTNIPENVTQYMKDQIEWVHKQIDENPTNDYWNLVNATFAQLYGMYDGFLAALKTYSRPNMTLTFDQFYLLTSVKDLDDALLKFDDACSFLLKLTNDNLYTGHNTWTLYSNMIKIYKVYSFNLQNPLVHTKRMSLSSRPGSLASIDDFYIVDDNRIVAETTINLNNSELYNYLHYDSVPYWIRVTIATLAYTTPQSWSEFYFAFRSGTYNNQWLLVDYNNYNAAKTNLSQAKDIIWVVEEFFNLTSAKDVTQELLIPQGYFASYNVAYNSTIQDLSKFQYNYTTAPRYFLFKKYAPGIENYDEFKYVMRLNNFSDTGDWCQAISSRCDLNKTTNFPKGAVECKTTNDALVSDHQVWMIFGPTTEIAPPFSWSDWPQYEDKMLEMPTSFVFDWVFLDPDQEFPIFSVES